MKFHTRNKHPSTFHQFMKYRYAEPLMSVGMWLSTPYMVRTEGTGGEDNNTHIKEELAIIAIQLLSAAGAHIADVMSCCRLLMYCISIHRLC